MFNRGWTTSLTFIDYSKLNSENTWKDLCFQLRITKHVLLKTITTLGEVQFSLKIHPRFTIDATYLSLCAFDR